MTNTSYEKLVEVYEKISSTSSRLEKTRYYSRFSYVYKRN